jgi:hypothetical protein
VDTVRILGKAFSVERVPEGPLQNNHVGEADYGKCVIWLREGQAPEQEADTLLHEIIHAADYAVHIGLEEQQVHALAGVLFAVFKDNPGLVDRLGFSNQ